MVLGFAVAESVIPPSYLPPWGGDFIKGFLKDTAGFLITAQVGMLGVISVAVGLITLIAQRDDKSSTSTEIRLYYAESLAYDIITSSTTLLALLAIQVFWPVQFGLHKFGLGSTNLFFKAWLTFVHILWLSVNVGGFAHFLSTTLRFVEPVAREQMRQRYTADVVLPDDLKVRLFRYFSNFVTKTILPDDGNDKHPSFMLGYDWVESGINEIERTFKAEQQLADVLYLPLRVAIRNWARRSQKHFAANATRPLTLETMQLPGTATVPLLFEGTYKGTVVLCRRDGGVPFRWWERLLIRASLRFRPSRSRGVVAPTPSAFLEELADKVIGQMDRLATTGFNAAFDELVRYHVFLIAAYNSHDENGNPLSLAEFGGIWGNPIEDWVHHYRRIFARAVEHLTVEPSFIETLAYAPYRLLQGKPAQVSKAVETTTLDLGPHLVVMLEEWVTRKTSLDTPSDAAAQPRLALAGSDRRSYERVLISFTGTWESLLHHSGLPRYERGKNSGLSQDVQWDVCRGSWPMLERHLRNSAYFLALAIWNEDEFGADRFRDLVLRWLDHAIGALQPDHLLRHHSLLSPQLFELDWAAVKNRGAPLLRHSSYPDRLDPKALFVTLLRGAFDDILAMAATVFFAWHLNGQQSSDIGVRAARLLVSRTFLPEEGSRRVGASRQPRTIFNWFFSTILRADLGSAKNSGTYQSYLDGVVTYLDRMSDRRVVPGRIYSSWGRDGLVTLKIPLLCVLLTNLPAEDDQTVINSFATLTSSEDFFSDGDVTLRRLQATFEEYRSAVVEPANLSLMDKGTKALAPFDLASSAPPFDLAGAITRLATLLEGIKTALEQQRLQRLKACPVDPKKLDRFREATDGALTGLRDNILPFEGFSVERRPSAEGSKEEWAITGISKAQLTEVPLDWEQSDLPGSIGAWFQEHVVQRLWNSFSKRARVFVGIKESAYPDDYWARVYELAATVGPNPVLIVPFASIGGDITEWLYADDQNRPANMVIAHLQGKGNGGGLSYEATINGIDVYGTNMPEDRSVLFSAEDLRLVVHRDVAKGRSTIVSFEYDDDPHNGTIKVEFDQHAVWRDSPVVELILGEIYGPPAVETPEDP